MHIHYLYMRLDHTAESTTLDASIIIICECSDIRRDIGLI
jgi:hypothetical protein